MHKDLTYEGLYLLDFNQHRRKALWWFLVTVRTSTKEAVHSSFCGISCDGSVLDYHGIDANGVLEHDTGELGLRDSQHNQGKQQARKLLYLDTKK